MPEEYHRIVAPRRYQWAEDYVKQWLEDNGFLVMSLQYHKYYPKKLNKILQKDSSPLKIPLICLPDFIVFDKRNKGAFLVEVKSCEQHYPAFWRFELRQMIKNITDSRGFGIWCLYAAVSPGGLCPGFWAHEAPRPRKIVIPGRWYNPKLEPVRLPQSKLKMKLPLYYKAIAHSLWQGVPIEERPDLKMGGSGDPFCWVASVDMRPDWRELIRNIDWL